MVHEIEYDNDDFDYLLCRYFLIYIFITSIFF